LAILLDGRDLPVVTIANPLTFEVRQEAWTYDGAITKLVANIIQPVPHA
jgi:hypothetical protein